MRKIFDLLPLTIEISASNHQLYYCPGQVYTSLLPFNLANLFMQPNRKSTLAKNLMSYSMASHQICTFHDHPKFALASNFLGYCSK